jgi:hypothetical protein
MEVFVKIMFDTSGWEKDDLRWKAGYDRGIKVPCQTLEEIKSALESAEGLGHTAEVVYPDMQEA